MTIKHLKLIDIDINCTAAFIAFESFCSGHWSASGLQLYVGIYLIIERSYYSQTVYFNVFSQTNSSHIFTLE